MEQLTRWTGNGALAQRIQYTLDRNLERAFVIAYLSAVTVPKLGRLTGLFGTMLVTGLALTQEDIHAATALDTLTPHKLAAYYHRREAFKHELWDLLDKFNHTMQRLVEGAE